MTENSVPLNIQDVIELLTNIKLKHGNLPIYIYDHKKYELIQLVQSEHSGILYRDGLICDGIPDFVEVSYE